MSDAKSLRRQRTAEWRALLLRALPFADATSDSLPLGRLLRLSLFQVSCGMALVLLTGTLNRVLIIELGVPAWQIAVMVGLPLLFAPFRAVVGFRSDHHRSAIGWRRVPYIWMGTLVQFGGLAIMPFALLLLSGDGNAPPWLAQVAAAIAFFMTGVGLHVTQTTGLALATDVAPEHSRPQVVALLYVMLLLGMLVSALVIGLLLWNFSAIRLIQVIQGAAVVTLVLNVIAIWKQEARQPTDATNVSKPAFAAAWQRYTSASRGKRFLVAVALGTAGFSMQDVLLEPYGAEILAMSVSATTRLTALLAIGSLCAFVVAALWLRAKQDAVRIAARGVVIGIIAFSCVVFAEPLASLTLFALGTLLIGFGGGLLGAGTLVMAMTMVDAEHRGLSLGAWGAAQATAAGLAISAGGLLRDWITLLATNGTLGTALNQPSVGYSAVYHIEILLLFFALIAIGPLVNRSAEPDPSSSVGLTQFPT